MTSIWEKLALGVGKFEGGKKIVLRRGKKRKEEKAKCNDENISLLSWEKGCTGTDLSLSTTLLCPSRTGG